MTSVLRVDPALLRDVAAAQEDVGAFVSAMTAGRAMTDAALSMDGLSSGAACEFAGAVFDSVARTVGEQLTDHSTKLAAAADLYHRADEELGSRLRHLAE